MHTEKKTADVCTLTPDDVWKALETCALRCGHNMILAKYHSSCKPPEYCETHTFVCCFSVNKSQIDMQERFGIDLKEAGNDAITSEFINDVLKVLGIDDVEYMQKRTGIKQALYVLDVAVDSEHGSDDVKHTVTIRYAADVFNPVLLVYVYDDGAVSRRLVDGYSSKVKSIGVVCKGISFALALKNSADNNKVAMLDRIDGWKAPELKYTTGYCFDGLVGIDGRVATHMLKEHGFNESIVLEPDAYIPSLCELSVIGYLNREINMMLKALPSGSADAVEIDCYYWSSSILDDRVMCAWFGQIGEFEAHSPTDDAAKLRPVYPFEFDAINGLWISKPLSNS